jgi:hypothetical protein
MIHNSADTEVRISACKYLLFSSTAMKVYKPAIQSTVHSFSSLDAIVQVLSGLSNGGKSESEWVLTTFIFKLLSVGSLHIDTLEHLR